MRVGDNKQGSDEYAERVAALEAGYKNLHKDVGAVADALGALGRDFREAIDKLQEKVVNQSRTPWGVLASWASVIILILTVVGSFYARDLSRLESEVYRIPADMEKEQELRDEIYRLKLDTMQKSLELAYAKQERIEAEAEAKAEEDREAREEARQKP